VSEEIYRLLYIEAGESFHNTRHHGSLTGQPIEDCTIQCCAEVTLAKQKVSQSDYTLHRIFHIKQGDPMSPRARRMTEFVAYCPNHIGIGFVAYHVGYAQNPAGEQERLFECTMCHGQFLESHGVECDPR
jgi:hypothetical protein